MNLFNRRKDRCEEYTVEIKPREGTFKLWGQSGRSHKFGRSSIEVVNFDDVG